jgi:CheY-like chemotaxis protein
MMMTTGILVVDDDVEDHMILSEGILHTNPSQLLYFATDGVEALLFLEKLHTDAKKVSLMVVDLNMPKMGGVELLRRLKCDDRFKEIPVVIYSTSLNSIEKQECLHLGALAYFTKPLSFNESVEIGKTFQKLVGNNN